MAAGSAAANAGIFAEWQPRYAEAGVASFPVRFAVQDDGKVDKRPMVTDYLRLGLGGSRGLVPKFGDAQGIGISLQRAGLTVLDIDTPDERVLADAFDRYGPTPIVVRSGGNGGHQLWFRNNGEPRRIRPDPAQPIDILGAGFVVAPPSRGPKRVYELVQGHLDDLPGLPPMRGLETGLQRLQDGRAGASPIFPDVAPGKRNRLLWEFCMKEAPFCDDLDALIDVARAAAAALSSPLSDEEIVRTARSAWGYEERGENHIGHRRRRPQPSEPDGLMWVGPDALFLWNVLRHYNAGRREFLVANEMAKKMPGGSWTLRRLTAARKALLDAGHIRRVRRASSGVAALYAWSTPS